MLLVVTTVGFLVHVYSIGYMRGDPGYYRFFSYLPLFVFSMLMLVLADNFLLLFFFWEAVGLCSYLLIGYYFKRRSAANAAKKAFIVNRIGDLGFGLGIMLDLLPRSARSILRRDGVFAQVAEPATSPADPDRDRAAALHRRDRQERAVPAPRLAAGRDGGPDAGLGPDPRRDDGDGRHLHGRALARDLQRIATTRDVGRRHHRRLHRLHGRDDRDRPERHQAGRRLFDASASSATWRFALGAGAWMPAIFHLMTHAFFKGCSSSAAAA